MHLVLIGRLSGPLNNEHHTISLVLWPSATWRILTGLFSSMFHSQFLLLPDCNCVASYAIPWPVLEYRARA